MKLPALAFIFIFFPFLVRGQQVGEEGVSDFFQLMKTQEDAWMSIKMFDLKNSLLSWEKIKLSEGRNHFISYEWTQYQTEEYAAVTLEELNLKIDYQKNKAATVEVKNIHLTQEEKNLLTLPPLISFYLSQKLKENPSGKKFDLIIIVPDKMLLLNFTLSKTNEDESQIEWELKASNFFVRLVVGPVYFIYNKGGKLLRIRDITLPVRPLQKTQIIFK